MAIDCVIVSQASDDTHTNTHTHTICRLIAGFPFDVSCKIMYAGLAHWIRNYWIIFYHHIKSITETLLEDVWTRLTFVNFSGHFQRRFDGQFLTI